MTSELDAGADRRRDRHRVLSRVRDGLEAISVVGSRSESGFRESERRTYYFDDELFDFAFAWVLAMGTHGGSETGEAFAAAAAIDEGDPRSWANAWTELAKRVEREGVEALEDGHAVSAREAYLRAYTYYRAPLFFISPLEDPDRYRTQFAAARSCFRQASGLLDYAVLPVEIPFEDENETLPGYFVSPDGTDGSDSGRADDLAPRKTVLGFGGGDTFLEDLYYFYAPAAVDRGYNLLLVDTPGQGTLPFDGLTFRPDAETSIGAVIDYARDHPAIAPDRLAAFGTSYGGYLVARAAAHDDRLRAIVANSVILDTHELWTENTQIEWLARIEGTPLETLFARAPLVSGEAMLAAVDTYKWRWGVDSLADLVAYSRTFTVNPTAIRCPTLLLVGQEEYEEYPASRRWQDEALDRIDHPKTDLRITPDALGAGGHAGLANVSVLTASAFDWLDDVLETTGERTR